MRARASQTVATAGEDGGDLALIRALRLAAAGCWTRAERSVGEACEPPAAGEAGRLLRVLLQGLALGARRPLRAGLVGQPDLTADERALLQLVAAAADHDKWLLEASVCWLVRPAAAATVKCAAGRLGALLRHHAVQRPLPERIASGAS
ncbi:MAG: hypothetical protein BroJett029_09480 [Alphaproteobacteria bacterium]|nr:MAG: hypothetical protein BroJett029_09480 [Alphaproteobacteria bacterium]